ESKLKNIEKNGEDILCMEKELIGLKEAYYQSALKLRACREHTAEILSKSVTGEFQFLKMDKAEFRVCIENVTEADWHKNGMDKVRFEIKTNAGEPFGALSKIASGGELARFMLALKVSLAHSSKIETMVFDEIDSGVGGSAAEAVGNRLLRLSQSVQVMAVTHSPQVASFSTTHFKVSKHSENNQTVTDVVCLSDVEKKEEIARMLSGEKITDEARAAADKLIEKSA
ncbi:MAG: DNA repair protein RecN, partial [Alphaproteobacteria bacterium]|nr:DNA repair protein RecN [Alphaproteobacteria bacterium]